jgi:beta-glucanase (GH16 family)
MAWRVLPVINPHSAMKDASPLRRRLTATLSFQLICLAAAFAPVKAAPPANYTLNWSDEFNGGFGTAPNSAYWSYDTGGGGWGNNELETYVSDLEHAQVVADSNATDGSALQITATNDSRGYESARIKTVSKVTPTYGFIEARIRLPYGQGIWPAFWMLGQDSTQGSRWPACGEVDIMENIGKQSEWSLNHGSSHSTNHSGGSALSATYTLPNNTYFKDAYHLFQLRWSQNKLAWYVDGNLYETRTTVDTGSDPWPFNLPFFFILNTAIGGNWPGNPDGTTVWPQHMMVDYIRVYNYTPTAVPSAPGGLSALTTGANNVNLTWTADSQFEVTYNVYRSTTANFTPSSSNLIASGVPLAFYGDKGLTAGTTYYYAIATVNSLGTSAPSTQVAATTAAAGAGIKINCAGGMAGDYVADMDFSGGAVGTGSDPIDTSLLGTDVPPQAVLQCQRYTASTYTIPNLTKGHTYTVKLFFAETYWNSAGAREFNVAINGTKVLTNLDVYAATGGKFKALAKTFTATPNTRGQIQIAFSVGAIDQPECCGIELTY